MGDFPISLLVILSSFCHSNFFAALFSPIMHHFNWQALLNRILKHANIAREGCVQTHYFKHAVSGSCQIGAVSLFYSSDQGVVSAASVNMSTRRYRKRAGNVSFQGNKSSCLSGGPCPRAPCQTMMLIFYSPTAQNLSSYNSLGKVKLAFLISFPSRHLFSPLLCSL